MIESKEIARHNYRVRSDVVPQQFITKAVIDCQQKSFCKLFVERGETATGGWGGDYYNSNGYLVCNDPNRMTVYITCQTCNKSWEVSGKIGQ